MQVRTPTQSGDRTTWPLGLKAQAYLGERDGTEVVGRDELAARLQRGEVVLLDVRPSSEYESGHSPGAVDTHRRVAPALRSLPPGADVVATVPCHTARMPTSRRAS